MHPLLWLGYEIEIVDRDFSRVPTTCIEIPCFVYIICVMCIDFSCFFAYPAGYSYFVIVFAVF